MKALLVFVGFLSVVSMAVIIYAQAQNNKQLIHELNVRNATFIIQKANIERLQEDNDNLRQANECLIKYSYRDRCITAIKHTPLPKLVKEKL